MQQTVGATFLQQHCLTCQMSVIILPVACVCACEDLYDGHRQHVMQSEKPEAASNLP